MLVAVTDSTTDILRARLSAELQGYMSTSVSSRARHRLLRSQEKRLLCVEITAAIRAGRV